MLTRAASIVSVAGLSLLTGCAGTSKHASTAPSTYEGTPTADQAASDLLARYAGRWSYRGRYVEDGEWHEYTMRAQARPILGGNFVEVRLGDPADPAGLTWIGDDPEEGVTFVTLNAGDGRTYVVQGAPDEEGVVALAEAAVMLADQAPVNEPGMWFEEVLEDDGGVTSRTYVAGDDGEMLIDEATGTRTGGAGDTSVPVPAAPGLPLDRMAGVWESQAWSLDESGNWVSSTSTTTMRPVLDGKFLVGDWVDHDESGEATTSGVITAGFTPNGQIIFTTMTSTDRHTWVWIADWDAASNVLSAWPAQVAVPGAQPMARPDIMRVEEFTDENASTVRWYRRADDGSMLLVSEENVTRAGG